ARLRPRSLLSPTLRVLQRVAGLRVPEDEEDLVVGDVPCGGRGSLRLKSRGRGGGGRLRRRGPRGPRLGCGRSRCRGCATLRGSAAAGQEGASEEKGHEQGLGHVAIVTAAV